MGILWEKHFVLLELIKYMDKKTKEAIKIILKDLRKNGLSELGAGKSVLVDICIELQKEICKPKLEENK